MAVKYILRSNIYFGIDAPFILEMPEKMHIDLNIKLIFGKLSCFRLLIAVIFKTIKGLRIYQCDPLASLESIRYVRRCVLFLYNAFWRIFKEFTKVRLFICAVPVLPSVCMK
jgi:hypothetical protein